MNGVIIVKKIVLPALFVVLLLPSYGAAEGVSRTSEQQKTISQVAQNSLSQAIETISNERIKRLRFIDSISVTGNFNGNDLDAKDVEELVGHTRSGFSKRFAGAGIELRSMTREDFDDLELSMGGIAVQVLANFNEAGRTKFGMCVISFEIYDFDSQSLAKAIIDKPLVWAAITYQAFPNRWEYKDTIKTLIDQSLDKAATQMIQVRTAPVGSK